MPDESLSQTVNGALARVDAGGRLTRKQGEILAEAYEDASRRLNASCRQVDGLRIDVGAHVEFGQRLARELNELYRAIDQSLDIAVAGVTVPAESEFRWQATDIASGTILTSGHCSTASLYAAVLHLKSEDSTRRIVLAWQEVERLRGLLQEQSPAKKERKNHDAR